MTLYDTKLLNAIESAESELSGINHYDHLTDQEIIIPPKDAKVYAHPYNYCYSALDLLSLINDIVEEIKLIRQYVKNAPVFSEQHTQFSLAFLLEFSYKNWIIRVNTLGEMIIHFAIHIYRLKLSSEDDLMEAIFNTDEIKKNNELNIALLNIVDFLKIDRLHKANGKTIRKTRNKIVHEGSFSHKKTSDLSWLFFEYEIGMKTNYDETDLIIDKNLANIEIEREITEFTYNFYEKINVLFILFEKEFKETFKQLMKDADHR